MRVQDLFGLAAIFAQAPVRANPEPDTFEGREIEVPSWEFDIVEGQPPVVMNGTIEAVLAQLEEDYPEFAVEVLEEIDAVEEADSLTDGDDHDLSKRQHFNKCFNMPTIAITGPIKEGIKNLRGRPGKPKVGAGKCLKPSCTYRSAILWCNDNTHSVQLDNFDAIANAAQVLVNQCSITIDGAQGTNGQRFHGNKQNVIVRGQDC